MRLKVFSLAATMAASAAVAPPVTQAQVFEAKSVDVDKGATEIATNNAFFGGFPVNADRVRASYEMSVGYGFTSWMKGGVKLNFSKPADEEFRLGTAGIEGQAVLKKFEGGLGLGFFAGLDFRVHRDETNTATFGPIVQLGTEKTHLILNPFFAKTYGPNRDDGIAFSLSWAVKQEIREGFAIGIEGYSTVPNIGNAPGTEFQEHRIGPVVYLERAISGARQGGRGLGIKDTRSVDDGKEVPGPKLGLELGVLFGLTDATQDTTVKIKGGIVF